MRVQEHFRLRSFLTPKAEELSTDLSLQAEVLKNLSSNLEKLTQLKTILMALH